MENISTIKKSTQEKFCKYIKIVNFSLMSMLANTSDAQDISHQIALHTPYRISFTGAGRSAETALQYNLFATSQDKQTAGYYEGTVDIAGDNRHEIGVVRTLGNQDACQLNGYGLFFHNSESDLFAIGLERKPLKKKSGLHTNIFPGYDNISKQGFAYAGVGYILNRKQFQISLKQDALATQEDGIVALPMRGVVEYNINDSAAIALTGILDRKNNDQNKLSAQMKVRF